jgi:xylulokinase
MADQDLTLSIDVGTGSVRAALVDDAGRIRAIAAEEQTQIVPAFGWAEQSVEGWWSGVVRAVARVLAQDPDAARRIAAICACGQMHGTVLIDDDGKPTRANAPLWNDKRTVGLVEAFEARHPPEAYLAKTGNPATPAWPGFKLAWLKQHDPEAYRRATTVLMPKDFINFRLTGERAMDPGDASASFLMDPTRRAWSKEMAETLGIEISKLPPIRDPLDVLGSVTPGAAAETGLRAGTPVLVGGADYPVSLLGSGVCEAGLASDVTGTSCILTLIADRPLLDPEICNVLTVEGHWGPFVLLESGGDAMRWARRAFHDNTLDYAAIVSRAAEAPAGADALFFLPYLAGERLGRHRNARAQFFGLGAAHGSAHLHRAVMEGVAFAAARHFRIMEAAAGQPIRRLIASGGGAKTALWLKIKASIYGVPVAVPKEAECGIVGCAVIAQTATGRRASLRHAIDALVRLDEEIAPDPAWADTYDRMMPLFSELYANAQGFYDRLDAIAAERMPEPVAARAVP